MIVCISPRLDFTQDQKKQINIIKIIFTVIFEKYAILLAIVAVNKKERFVQSLQISFSCYRENGKDQLSSLVHHTGKGLSYHRAYLSRD